MRDTDHFLSVILNATIKLGEVIFLCYILRILWPTVTPLLTLQFTLPQKVKLHKLLTYN